MVQWLPKLLLSPPPPSAGGVVVVAIDVVPATTADVGVFTAVAAELTAGDVVIESFFRRAGVFRGVPLALPRLAPLDVEEVEEAGDMERSSLVRGLRTRLFRELVLRLDASQSSS